MRRRSKGLSSLNIKACPTLTHEDDWTHVVVRVVQSTLGDETRFVATGIISYHDDVLTAIRQAKYNCNLSSMKYVEYQVWSRERFEGVYRVNHETKKCYPIKVVE